MKTVVSTWLWVGLWSFAAGCDSNLAVKTQEIAAPEEEQDTPSPTKLSNQGECLDPDLSRIPSDVSLTLCSGELAQGQLPVCSEDGGTHCITDETFVATNKTKVDPAKISSGMTIAGVMGTMLPPPADCAADGAVGCVTTNDFKAAAMANVLAGNIKSGVTIAGVTTKTKTERSPHFFR